LLVLRDCETGTGNCELHDEQAEQDNHVEEESDLVVFGSTVQAAKSKRDQNYTTSDDTWNDRQVRKTVKVKRTTY
jgi:hypothetical protein